MVDQMVDSGDAEAIFRKAIQEQGRGQVGTREQGCCGDRELVISACSYPAGVGWFRLWTP